MRKAADKANCDCLEKALRATVSQPEVTKLILQVGGSPMVVLDLKVIVCKCVGIDQCGELCVESEACCSGGVDLKDPHIGAWWRFRPCSASWREQLDVAWPGSGMKGVVDRGFGECQNIVSSFPLKGGDA